MQPLFGYVGGMKALLFRTEAVFIRKSFVAGPDVDEIARVDGERGLPTEGTVVTSSDVSKMGPSAFRRVLWVEIHSGISNSTVRTGFF